MFSYKSKELQSHSIVLTDSYNTYIQIPIQIYLNVDILQNLNCSKKKLHDYMIKQDFSISCFASSKMF